MELRDEICRITGGQCPAVILSNLHRSRLDPNREVNEATFNVEEMVEAYNEYMGSIEAAQSEIQIGRGLLLDIHGHGHAIQRAELGYTVTAERLNNDDLDYRYSSIKQLYLDHEPISFDELLRGSLSYGKMLEDEHFDCIPCPKYPKPSGDPYFTGGYITQRFSSRDDPDSVTDAIQIESARSDRENRTEYVAALARVTKLFMETYLN